MQFKVIQRVLGLLLMVFSFTMLPPVLIAFLTDRLAYIPFLESFGILLVMGFVIWLPVFKVRKEMRLRDGFMIVVLFWSVLGVVGGLPMILSEQPSISVIDAIFESISGLTTTGATVLTGLDNLPKSILFYRQQLQWLGGMGIIVLAVAILPILGVGGMQMYKAETPGPVKDNKLTPRITETAKALWYIYLVLTIACGLAYWLAGMTWFDAVSHSFSTIAIGGFSTHDASIGYFNSPLIESIAIVFMLISGINFALHFYASRSMSVAAYLKDSECITYFSIIGIGILIVCGFLFIGDDSYSLVKSIREGIFQTVSIATTTGFATSSFHVWPTVVPIFLIFLSFVGGCAGSTGGGMKVVRVMLLIKQGYREIRKLMHPNGTFVVKVGNKAMPNTVLDAVWGFFSAYILVFILFLFLLMASGLDHTTAFSAVVAMMNNLGPGLGSVAENYSSIDAFDKTILSLAMIMGRLEIFTMLVLLTPAFWRN